MKAAPFLVHRKASLFDGSTELEPLATFKNIPVFIGCTDQPQEEDLVADLDFDICRNTGFIQVRNLLDPEIVYRGYHSEAVGELWDDHHKDFARYLVEGHPKRVLEI